MRPITYDYRCYELAELFLGDVQEICNEDTKDRLARHIQCEIESWIGYETNHPGEA